MNAMRRLFVRLMAVGLSGVVVDASASGGIVVIGHANVTSLDAATLEKVYTGRVIEINGTPVIAVNASSGSAVRTRFLQAFLNEDEDKYTAYWVVRRYIGKGAPPRELGSSAAVIAYVRSTPGAIGYIDESDVQPGVNVLLK